MDNHFRYALLLLKPDLLSRNLDESLSEELKKYSLTPIYSCEKLLTEKDIRAYQPALELAPKELGEAWKEKLISHQTSAPCKVLVVKGINAIPKTLELRNEFRKKFFLQQEVHDPDDLYVKNLLHTADDENDLLINFEVLLPELIGLHNLLKSFIAKKKGGVLKAYDIVTQGAPVFDTLFSVEDENNFYAHKIIKDSKGGIISNNSFDSLLEIAHKNKYTRHYFLGGSSAGTADLVARLGGNIFFSGVCGQDNASEDFCRSLDRSFIDYDTTVMKKGNEIARGLVFVTRNGDRTLCFKPNSSIYYNSDLINKPSLQKTQYFFACAHDLWNDGNKNALEESVFITKSHGGKFIFSLGDTRVIAFHRESILRLVKKADIVLGNINEYLALYLVNNEKDLLDKIKEIQDKTFFITLGKAGCIVLFKGSLYREPAKNLGKVIDTTGAGDAAAAGFIKLYIEGNNITDCLKAATYCGGLKSTILGPRITREYDAQIFKFIKSNLG